MTNTPVTSTAQFAGGRKQIHTYTRYTEEEGILYHCRCANCRQFRHHGYEEYSCVEGIGGTAVVWGTGQRICDPPPEAWHYCAGYRGPRISQDTWTCPVGGSEASSLSLRQEANTK